MGACNCNTTPEQSFRCRLGGSHSFFSLCSAICIASRLPELSCAACESIQGCLLVLVQLHAERSAKEGSGSSGPIRIDTDMLPWEALHGASPVAHVDDDCCGMQSPGNMETAEDLTLNAICVHTGPNLSDRIPLRVNHAGYHLHRPPLQHVRQAALRPRRRTRCLRWLPPHGYGQLW